MKPEELKKKFEVPGAKVAGELVRGENFSAIHFDRVEIVDSSLSKNNFTKSRFDSCRFQDVTIRTATLVGVHVERCEVFGGGWGQSVLSGARIFHAAFERTGFDETSWKDALVESCSFSGGSFMDATLKGAIFYESAFREVGFLDTEFSGCAFVRCRFESCELEEMELGRVRFEDCVFDEVSFLRASFQEADFSGSDLRGVELTGPNGPESLDGALYDQRTVFPEGFDPQAHGMKLVETSASNTDAKPKASALHQSLEQEFEVEEGVFFKAGVESELRELAKPVAQLMGASQWPPTDYTGAEADKSLLEEAEALTHGLSEFSSMQLPYSIAIVREDFPGEEDAVLRRVDEHLVSAEELLGASVSSGGKTSDDVGSPESSSSTNLDKTLMFQKWSDSFETDDSFDCDWWKEWMSPEEFQSRLALSEFMSQNLSGLEYICDEVEDEWSVVRYEGVTQSGARLVVFAPRYDAA